MRFITFLLVRLLLSLMVVSEQSHFLVQSELTRLMSNSSDNDNGKSECNMKYNFQLSHLTSLDTSMHQADDDGPRPFGLLLLLVLIISLIIGAGITYNVCCTKPDPVRKRNYPYSGKTTKTKKATKKVSNSKDQSKTKKKSKKSKKEPKTVTKTTGKKSTVPRSALGGKAKSKAPKSSAGSGSDKNKSTGNASSKGNKTTVKSAVDTSLVNKTTPDRKIVTMAPLPKKNIFGQNISEVPSLGSVGYTFSKESVNSEVSNAVPMTKIAAVTRREQKEVTGKKKK